MNEETMGLTEFGDTDRYHRWRDDKLAAYGDLTDFAIVELADMANPRPAEVVKMSQILDRFNMVLYAGKPTSLEKAKKDLRALGRRFGLERLDANLCADEDAITPLAVSQASRRRRYIPYTNRAINWHTDGYYNPPQRKIQALALHCVNPAADGGDSRLMDPEIAYIMLREENPDYIRALTHPEAMTIPANDEGDLSGGGGFIRPAQGGPVFSFNTADGAMHMRYTARSRSIEWRDDATTAAAVAFLADLMDQPSPYVFHHRLAAGQGVLCNNVLHYRDAFTDTDDCRRMLLRARYYDRIATGA